VEMLIFKAAIAILAIQFAHTLSDPCASLECKKPEIACLKLVSGESNPNTYKIIQIYFY